MSIEENLKGAPQKGYGADYKNHLLEIQTGSGSRTGPGCFGLGHTPSVLALLGLAPFGRHHSASLARETGCAGKNARQQLKEIFYFRKQQFILTTLLITDILQ